MGALSRLFVGQKYPPSWANYETEDTAVLEAKYFVPLFWFAFFQEKNFGYLEDPDDEDEKFICFTSFKAQSLETIEKRRSQLRTLTRQADPYLDLLKARVHKVSGQYLSVDITELYLMEEDPESFIDGIKSILRAFKAGSVLPLDLLTKMACLEKFDSILGDYETEEHAHHQYHAIGLPC